MTLRAVSPRGQDAAGHQSVHSGSHALSGMSPQLRSATLRFSADWREFDELRFWAYLGRPSTLGRSSRRAGRVLHGPVETRLDGLEGAAHQALRMLEGPRAGRLGSDQTFGFRAQGYGQPPVLVSQSSSIFALHSPKILPHKTLQDWVGGGKAACSGSRKSPCSDSDRVSSPSRPLPICRDPLSLVIHGVCATAPRGLGCRQRSVISQGRPTLIANALR